MPPIEGKQICICLCKIKEQIISTYSDIMSGPMLNECTRCIDECMIGIAAVETGDSSYEDVIKYVEMCRDLSRQICDTDKISDTEQRV